MSKIRLRYTILILSVILFIGGELTAWGIENNFGAVESEIITLTTAESVNIEAKLQIPLSASSSNPLPAVIVIHGSMQSKEWLTAFNIELIRQEIIVLSIDAAGHGNSQPASGDRGGAVALEFLDNHPYVSKIGMCGHSMGAGFIISALEASTVKPDAIVFVGGGGRGISDWANDTYPRNLLITVGRYDELFNIPMLYSDLQSVFGTTTDVQSGVLYGSFSTETARKLVIGGTNHLFETIDPIIIGETVAWFVNSFNTQDSNLLSPSIPFIYPLYLITELVAVIGLNISLFPLLLILLEIPLFKSLKHPEHSTYEVDKKTYWTFGLLYGIIGLGSFIPALLLPSIPFPQQLGGTLGIWLLGSALISLVLLVVYKRKKLADVSFTDFGIDIRPLKQFLNQFVKAAILAFGIGVWIHICVSFVDLFLLMDIRVFLPFFQDLTLQRLFLIPFYLIFTIPFFFVEGMWLTGFLRRESKNTWFKTYSHQTFHAIVIKCVLYFVILLLQLIMGLILGSAFIKGMYGYYLLFLWMFGPFFIITTAILVWSYQITKRVYVGALFNALIFSWGMATILAISI